MRPVGKTQNTLVVTVYGVRPSISSILSGHYALKECPTCMQTLRFPMTLSWCTRIHTTTLFSRLWRWPSTV